MNFEEREKRGSGGGKKEQETRSHKQNPKFVEAGTLLLRSWTFFFFQKKKNMFFTEFSKNATSEKQKNSP